MAAPESERLLVEKGSETSPTASHKLAQFMPRQMRPCTRRGKDRSLEVDV